MKGIASFFKKKWVIQLIGVIALGVLIWFIGPLIAIAGSVPLASELIRGLCIAVLAVAWIILRLVAELRASRKDQQFAAELAQPEVAKSAETIAAGENIELLSENFDKALQLLRETRSGRRSDQRFLYELPWYIIIGPPGSGKTTALLNSGLRFPLADRLGKQPIPGVSGTRNCEWLFTDDAVLIDTAGRYTTQESYQAVDAAEWTGFLDLLKRHRPRRPINGVLVSMSLSDLLQQTEEERTQHAKAIRQRLQELYVRLGIRFPVYMLLTKSDLVAGFNDFFADLSEERRAQVWGETFVYDDAAQPADVLARFAAGFDELMERLNRHTLRRIQEERDLQRRSLVLDFSQQLALLKPALLAFLDGVFVTSRYETKPLLRGVYLTSGTQEGTPIDRVMGQLAATFRFNRQPTPVYSGRGRSYFLTRLLKDVVFPEAGLAGTDPRVEKRRRLLQTGAYLGAAGLVLAGIAAWIVSYQRNTSAIDRVRQDIEQFRAARIDASSLNANLRTLLPKLNALQAARDVYQDYGLLSHFGLYQGNKLEQAAGHAYEHWLKAGFLPLIVRDMAGRMSGPEASNPEILYEYLRVYLMLGQPERMDPKIAAPWIRSAWERNFAAEPEVLGGLSRHLDNLLALKLDPAPLDENLVAMARARLTQVNPAIQLYSRFKNEALLDKSHDLRLGDALGPQAGQVFVAADGRDPGTITIPGFFTAEWGYKEWFLNRSRAFVKDAVTGNWVLGRPGDAEAGEIDKLHRDLQNLYLADYRDTWKNLLANVRPRPAKDVHQTIGMLEILSNKDQSPLRKLLQAVKDNTALTQVSPLNAAADAKLAGAAAALPQAAGAQKLLEAVKRTGGGTSGDDPVLAVETAFRDLNGLMEGNPPALDTTLGALGALRDQFLQVGQAAASGQALKSAAGALAAGGAGGAAQAKSAIANLPAPVKALVGGVAQSGASQTQSGLVSGARKELNAMLATGVTAPCKAAFNGRYPFNPGSRTDATLMDFTRILGPNGAIDQFFQTNLKTFVDTNRPVWGEVDFNRQPLGLAPGTIRQFQNAERIRAAFYAAGGAAPSVVFELKPLAMDANIATFRLIAEGQEVIHRHGPEQVTRLQWPGPNAGSGARLVFETLDGRQASRSTEGPWATFRLLDGATIARTEVPERFIVTFSAEGYSARYELRAGSVMNPFNLPELRQFSCPDGL